VAVGEAIAGIVRSSCSSVGLWQWSSNPWEIRMRSIGGKLLGVKATGVLW